MPDQPDGLVDEFDAFYRIVDEPVMRTIERAVTGSDYGASSYTTREQADRLAGLLRLAPGSVLLDFGSGAGWPGIHLARSLGCEVVLTDVPLEGLRRADRRRRVEGVAGGVVAASAALLPLRDRAFDAATSSDALC
jgi:cyclopropane fatty-acyl-phospholipid synthase-like methyltransferase